jgi:NAD(P)-dependent dehydrogenase (short-subunit alcohol dehydrogenase family)
MIARGFLANGAASICIVDVLGERLEAVKAELTSLAAELGKECQIQTQVSRFSLAVIRLTKRNRVQADLSNEAGLNTAATSIRATHESVDSLVLCAGVRKMQKKTYTLGQPLSALAEAMQSMDYADLELSFKVNVFAPYYMVANLIDLLGAAATKGGGRGNVVCFSSVAAQHYG